MRVEPLHHTQSSFKIPYRVRSTAELTCRNIDVRGVKISVVPFFEIALPGNYQLHRQFRNRANATLTQHETVGGANGDKYQCQHIIQKRHLTISKRVKPVTRKRKLVKNHKKAFQISKSFDNFPNLQQSLISLEIIPL